MLEKNPPNPVCKGRIKDTSITKDIKGKNKMNVRNKVCLSLILTLTVISCSNQNNLVNNSISDKNNLSNNISFSSSEKISTFKLSDSQGAEISFKITHPLTPSLILERGNNNIIPNSSPSGISYSPLLSKRGAGGELVPPLQRGLGGFSSKANANGIPSKTGANVTSFLVYLIKDNSTTGYPAGGDPLNVSNIVAGPFTVSNSGITGVKFTGVNNLAVGAYYVAVRAVDSSNVDLIKDNNGSGTAWTGTTASTTLKVAVSSGAGITVNNSYQVNTTSPLVVTTNLNDGLGATVSAQTTVNELNTNPSKKDLGYFIDTVAPISLNPRGIVVSPQNDIYVCQRNGARVLKIDGITNAVTNIAGTGANGFSGDGGQATLAQLAAPRGLALDSSGNVYIADGNNNRIRKVTVSTGVITTIAGTGTNGFSGDGGQATSAQISTSFGVSVDQLGNVYITDRSNQRIRKVTVSTGVITTIAGTGTAGFSGDGGQSTSAQLSDPTAVKIDSLGDIYIADGSNSRIRKVKASTGIITTIAGTGTAGFSGDGGQATSAQLNNPVDLYIDNLVNIYIADAINARIRKISASTGIITTIAGTGTAAFSGDGGVATNANIRIQQFSFSEGGISGDNLGNIYIADFGNNRVRKLY